jgi:hypothetical protein
MFRSCPEDQTLGSHSGIFTVTLARLPQDETRANEQTEKSIKTIAASPARVADKMIEFQPVLEE